MTAKWFVCLCAVLMALMPLSAAFAEGTDMTELPSLAAFTGLDMFLSETEDTEENPVVSVSYRSNAYAPGPMKRFIIQDPDEIAAFIDALTQARIAGPGMFATDYYPHFTLTRADGTYFELSFSHHWLNLNNEYYTLADDDALWTLTADYTNRYMEAYAEAAETSLPD